MRQNQGPLRRTSQSRADELYETLFRAIVKGELAPDERLVEEAIADAAGMSRTPVREAVRRLEMDGLVQRTSHGVVVSRFTIQQMADLCVVRESLEGLAARLAAQARSDVDEASLAAISADTKEATAKADIDRLVQLNRNFHGHVWEAARNPYLERQLTVLRSLIERMQTTTFRDPRRRTASLHEHNEILAAISMQRPDDAERLTREHFRKTMTIRLSLERERSRDFSGDGS